ncbi:ABC transporter ATP-binding protein [Kibdelosporangium aridum]|uniref:ABC transporter ATP-binding protein n=1 Tax=Kibdelosporangium aridum TaxID=2030 RepID=A0A428YNA9_KIBAR|nr:ATP-binding cassette domain-containing protein [Kibdelosporangium aridum]RSM69673.1 ABC transporter ATP-binding protein [Kibdelosporangium aridum]
MSIVDELVTVADLRLHVGGVSVVDGIGFTVRAGESLALVGASGSGKTTTALAVLGHLRNGVTHTGGTVHVAGHTMLPASGAVNGVVGYVGQDPASVLNPYRRISATLRSALGTRRRQAVADLLERVALPPALADRYSHQLSGGQQQRVALAVALARNPRLLILDEPTSALDPTAAAEVRRELLALRANRVSLLWITHDLTAVRGAVDRVLVLDAGRVVEDAPYDRLMARPASTAAAALVAAAEPAVQQRPAHESPGDPVLEVRDLVAGYPRRPPVLSGVSLDLRPGQSLAVIGASGIGKSTFARCLAGLHHPTAGTIRLNGTALAPDVRARGRGQRAAVQFVSQDPAGALHPTQDVRTALARPLRLLRGIRDRREQDVEIARLLAAVRLPADYTRRLPRELSGGERQRVALARALAAQPAVLICDEITAALDTVTQAEILNLLAEHCRDTGLSIVLITHNLAAANHIADEIHVLADGRLEQSRAAQGVR